MWKDTLERHGSQWFIFNYQFRCRMPALASRSAEDIQRYGVRAWGDPVRDRQAIEELIERPLTISQMADYFAEGVTVRIVKHADTEAIYTAVQTHLERWSGYVRSSLTPQRAPLEDLIKLDKLAHAVYRHAVVYKASPQLESMLTNSMGASVLIGVDQIFKPVKTTYGPEDGPVVDDGPEQRQSLSRDFERQLAKSGRVFLPDSGLSAFRDARRQQLEGRHGYMPPPSPANRPGRS